MTNKGKMKIEKIDDYQFAVYDYKDWLSGEIDLRYFSYNSNSVFISGKYTGTKEIGGLDARIYRSELCKIRYEQKRLFDLNVNRLIGVWERHVENKIKGGQSLSLIHI